MISQLVRRMRPGVSFLFLFILTASLHSQNFVTVVLRPPPPNQLKVADLWEITLMNTGRTSLSVYLKGSVTEQKDGLVATATSATFSLPPGTKVFSARNMGQLSPVNTNFKNSRYEDIVNAIGSAPSGTYDICIEVWGAAVSAAGNAGILATSCVNSHTVESTSQPLLVSPSDGSDAPDANPMFTWAMPTPVSTRASVTYTLRIVQLLGRQSPTAAMQANPAWAEINNLRTTTIQYPPGSQPLVSGALYAWKVTAVLRGALLGESEVWSFRYSPVGVISEIPAKTASNAAKKKVSIDVLEELLHSCSDEGGVKIMAAPQKK